MSYKATTGFLYLLFLVLFHHVIIIIRLNKYEDCKFSPWIWPWIPTGCKTINSSLNWSMSHTYPPVAIRSNNLRDNLSDGESFENLSLVDVGVKPRLLEVTNHSDPHNNGVCFRRSATVKGNHANLEKREEENYPISARHVPKVTYDHCNVSLRNKLLRTNFHLVQWSLYNKRVIMNI